MERGSFATFSSNLDDFSISHHVWYSRVLGNRSLVGSINSLLTTFTKLFILSQVGFVFDGPGLWRIGRCIKTVIRFQIYLWKRRSDFFYRHRERYSSGYDDRTKTTGLSYYPTIQHTDRSARLFWFLPRAARNCITSSAQPQEPKCLEKPSDLLLPHYIWWRGEYLLNYFSKSNWNLVEVN